MTGPFSNPIDASALGLVDASEPVRAAVSLAAAAVVFLLATLIARGRPRPAPRRAPVCPVYEVGRATR